MRRYKAWRADGIRFAVRGAGAQNFISACARAGVRLQHLRCTADGYAGRAMGRDLAQMQAAAQRGGWQLEILARRGPGPLAERLWRRPGLPVGAALFLALCKLLSTFIWTIDFGALTQEQQQNFRQVLAQNEICEGSLLTQGALRALQKQVALQNGDYGWVSLNFAGGCLFVETTPLQVQPIRTQAQEGALYAAANAEIVALHLESGFAVVGVGQFVAQGQLLANAVKLDRGGDPVNQPAVGKVVARVEKNYQARRSLQAKQRLLTGPHTEHTTLHLLGRAFGGQEGTTPPDAAPGCTQQEWLPLQFGRLALPGCLYRVTCWAAGEQAVRYSAAAAQALARRDCRLALQQEFPSAQPETLTWKEQSTENVVECTLRAVFLADIAVPGPPAAVKPEDGD